MTTHLDKAIEISTTELGFEGLARFSPSMDVVTGEGRRGPAKLDCAFSAGRELVVEPMQPLDGLVGVFGGVGVVDPRPQYIDRGCGKAVYPVGPSGSWPQREFFAPWASTRATRTAAHGPTAAAPRKVH